MWIPADAIITADQQEASEIAPPAFAHDKPGSTDSPKKTNQLSNLPPGQNQAGVTPPPQQWEKRFSHEGSQPGDQISSDLSGNPSNRPPAHPSIKAKSSTQTAQRHATLITAEPAQSRLNTASDGKLPELTLEALNGDKKDQGPTNDSNRLLVFGIIIGSLLVSAVLLLLDTNSLSNTESETSDEIREIIKRKYFGTATETWARYQIYLRDAALARSQRNYSLEQQYYRRVLHLLNAQNLDNTDEGITGLRKRSSDGSLRSDEELMELISRLLKTNN